MTGFGLVDVCTGREAGIDKAFQVTSVRKPIAVIVILESFVDHGSVAEYTGYVDPISPMAARERCQIRIHSQ